MSLRTEKNSRLDYFKPSTEKVSFFKKSNKVFKSSSDNIKYTTSLVTTFVILPVHEGCANFSISAYQVMDQIEPYLYEFTSQHRGSISAEHGLGFKKRNFIHFSKSDSAVGLMKQIKTVFDPLGIMNPYKVLPDQ